MNANDTITCPWCKSGQFVHEAMLGALGNLFHFTCRHCKGEFSLTDPTKDTDHATDDQSNSEPAIQE